MSDALLLTDIQAAKLANISRASVHRLRASGAWGPAPIRLGRALRFARLEVTRWIEAGCPPADAWQEMQSQEQRRRLRAI